MAESKPPSGRTIVLELQREMESRTYPLMYRTLAPGVFHVYFHPDDFREIEPVAALIVTDAQQALNQRVDELNNRSRWTTLVSGREAPIEVPPAGWEIHLHPDTNGELARGEIGIESRLSVPPPPRYEGGSPTTRIAKTVVTGTIRRDAGAATIETPAPPAAPSVAPPSTPPVHATGPAPASVSVPAAVSAGTTETQSPVGRAAAAASSVPVARLSYTDADGPHAFVMRKEQISIGRGGSAHWVDVQVIGSARVSREHCRIRRTPDDRFVLQDVSTWGTSVNGQRVAPFLQQQEGAVHQSGHEHELTSPSRIELADALVIDFSVDG